MLVDFNGAKSALIIEGCASMHIVVDATTTQYNIPNINLSPPFLKHTQWEMLMSCGWQLLLKGIPGCLHTFNNHRVLYNSAAIHIHIHFRVWDWVKVEMGGTENVCIWIWIVIEFRNAREYELLRRLAWLKIRTKISLDFTKSSAFFSPDYNPASYPVHTYLHGWTATGSIQWI